jgi:hypothetical protein
MTMSNLVRTVSPSYRKAYEQTLKNYLVPKGASLKTEIRQGISEDKIHNAHSFWYNPATDYRLVEKDPVTGNRPKLQSIYFGESYDRTRPTWDIRALDYGAYSGYLKSADASTDRQATKFDSLVGVFGDEIAEDAYNYLRALEADVMTSGDFPNMQLLTSFIDILDVEQKQFGLVNAVTTKATNVLNLQTASYSRFQITEEIGELEAPESRKGTFTTQQFKLKKSGGHIAWSDEFMMQNFVVDPYSYASQNLASDIVRIKAKKIAAALATLTSATTPTGDFSAFANSGAYDHAAYRPLLIFAGMRNEVLASYNVPIDTVASNDRTYNYYMSSPDITPIANTPQSLANTVAGSVPAPGLPPGTSWFVDNSLPDNTLYYYNRNAVWHIQGVSRSSNYRDELPGQSGVVYRDWFNATLYQQLGRKMTGCAP